jgi:hypothetical protein
MLGAGGRFWNCERTLAHLNDGLGGRRTHWRSELGNTFERGTLMISTLASTLFRDCHSGLVPQTRDSLRFSGGDDGARTRDLCRDSEPENCN